jgi:hypothetical protein
MGGAFRNASSILPDLVVPMKFPDLEELVLVFQNL